MKEKPKLTNDAAFAFFVIAAVLFIAAIGLSYVG